MCRCKYYSLTGSSYVYRARGVGIQGETKREKKGKKKIADEETSVLRNPPKYSVKGRPHYYSTKKEEYAIIKFSLDADLSSLFTWNTKQLFVYVTAEWPSSSAGGGTNETNKAVIWDSIITSPSADHLSNLGPATLKKLRRATAGRTVDPSRGLLRLQNQRPKYQITHPTGRVAETSDDVRLRLHYNVQPWVGVLTWDHRDTDYGLWRAIDGADSDSFALPPLKKKDDESAKKTKKAKNT